MVAIMFAPIRRLFLLSVRGSSMFAFRVAERLGRRPSVGRLMRSHSGEHGIAVDNWAALRIGGL